MLQFAQLRSAASASEGVPSIRRDAQAVQGSGSRRARPYPHKPHGDTMHSTAYCKRVDFFHVDSCQMRIRPDSPLVPSEELGGILAAGLASGPVTTHLQVILYFHFPVLARVCQPFPFFLRACDFQHVGQLACY